ncbi:MAG TPA: LamG domain-containing protein, partial [Kofleriaceae bacterium]
ETGHLTPSALGVTFVPGKLGMAVSLDMYAWIRIQDTPLLDEAAVTMEAWIRPTSYPMSSGGRKVIWETDSSYWMALVTHGELQCQDSRTGFGTILLGGWTHVACTVGNGGSQSFINGVPKAQSTLGIFGTSTDGAGIGGGPTGGWPFIGEIDGLRIYRGVRTPAEICAAAGRTDCQ